MAARGWYGTIGLCLCKVTGTTNVLQAVAATTCYDTVYGGGKAARKSKSVMTGLPGILVEVIRVEGELGLLLFLLGVLQLAALAPGEAVHVHQPCPACHAHLHTPGLVVTTVTCKF